MRVSARESRCFWPPERCRYFALRRSCKPTNVQEFIDGHTIAIEAGKEAQHLFHAEQRIELRLLELYANQSP